MSSDAPLVTVCIPTFEGREFLAEALESALAQTWRPLEIVLSDSGSSDGTLDIAAEFAAASPVPFRIVGSPRPGMVANWNACLDHARGRWIKYLFQDDVLDPDCVETLVGAARESENVGLAFSRRRLVVDPASADDPVVRFNAEHIRDLHAHWSELRPSQQGATLLRDPKLLDEPINKIGEPSTVLLSRRALDDVGRFDERLRQCVDLELWWRLLARWDAAFVDRELSSFRLHAAQQTGVNTRERTSDGALFFKVVRDGPVQALLRRRARAEVRARAEGGRWLPPSERALRSLARLLGRRSD